MTIGDLIYYLVCVVGLGLLLALLILGLANGAARENGRPAPCAVLTLKGCVSEVILPDGEYHARQYGTGRTNSGPSGRQMTPGRVHARAVGVQRVASRNSWCWNLLATPNNCNPKLFPLKARNA